MPSKITRQQYHAAAEVTFFAAVYILISSRQSHSTMALM